MLTLEFETFLKDFSGKKRETKLLIHSSSHVTQIVTVWELFYFQNELQDSFHTHIDRKWQSKRITESKHQNIFN